MTKKKFDPPETDLERQPLMEAASAALSQFPEGAAQVYFKFTCSECGARCVLSRPNVLYTQGVCYECEAVVEVARGGFMLALTIRGGQQPVN